MTKSNFGKYFRYKLGKSKSSIIIFAILNFLSTILPCIILFNHCNYVKTLIETYNDFDYYGPNIMENVYNIMKISAAVCMIMITVTTVKSVKIYYDRAAMDTLGCLPLSYGERFWGDLLSSFCANFISLAPFSVVTVILINAMKPLMNIILESAPYFSETTEIIEMIPYLVFVLMFVYIGIYAVTTFINSCCGKFGSAVLFSFVAMAVIPGIYTVYANYFFSFVIGADKYNEIASNVGMLPPFGSIFSIMMRFIDPGISYAEKFDLRYFIEQPRYPIVSIIVFAAFLAGAYFIGKKRKAEKTGESFMFKAVFHILSLTLLVLMIGAVYLSFFEKEGTIGIIKVLLISFLFYIILELSQNKSFKGFWKTVIRFSAVFGTCIAFVMIVKSTNSFNFYKKLPSEGSITEVRISGEYFYSGLIGDGNEGYIYKSKDSVSVILGEHKKLLMSDDIKTGSKLNITYITKGGGKFIRRYSVVNDSEAIKSFSKTVKALEEFDPSVLGILNNSDFSGMKADFDRLDGRSDLPHGIIRGDKLNELAELLRYDIENHYFEDSRSIGYLIFREKQSGTTLGNYRISEDYEETVKFLNDRSNYVDSYDDNPAGNSGTTIYSISYDTNKEEGLLTDIYISFSEDDPSEYAKELLSYIEPENSTDEYSPDIWVADDKYNGYGIRIENRNAAIRATIKLFREKYAR